MASNLYKKYKSKLLHKATVSLDEMLANFLEIMPQSYFETNDEATILQHMAAILFASVSGNEERIALANHDATAQTFIHFGSYPGLLSDILDNLPEQKSIQLARAYTADDNSVVIDIFEFEKPAESEEISRSRKRKLEKLKASLKIDAIPDNAVDMISNVNAYYLQRFNIFCTKRS